MLKRPSKGKKRLIVGGVALVVVAGAVVLAVGLKRAANHAHSKPVVAKQPAAKMPTSPPKPTAPVQVPAPPPPPPKPTHDYAIPPVANGMVPLISRIPTKENVVFLTIDDGISTSPNDSQIMQDDHVKATFFLVYRFIHDNAAFFGNLAQATGSDIQNHSYDHFLLSNLSYDQQVQDICKNADIFAQWYGKRPVLFRPSGGVYNNNTLRAAATCGMKALFLWNVTVNNGSLQYQSGRSLRPGDVVLMHFRTTFAADMNAFAAAAKSAGLRTELLIDWM